MINFALYVSTYIIYVTVFSRIAQYSSKRSCEQFTEKFIQNLLDERGSLLQSSVYVGVRYVSTVV